MLFRCQAGEKESTSEFFGGEGKKKTWGNKERMADQQVNGISDMSVPLDVMASRPAFPTRSVYGVRICMRIRPQTKDRIRSYTLIQAGYVFRMALAKQLRICWHSRSNAREGPAEAAQLRRGKQNRPLTNNRSASGKMTPVC